MIYRRVRSLVAILLVAAGLMDGQAHGQAAFRFGNQTLVVNNDTNGYDVYRSIAIDSSGNIYAAPCGTSNYSNVCKETPQSNGTYSESILFSQTANGLNTPVSVAVDTFGNVYIADELNSRVLKETLAGGGYTQSVVTDYHNGLIFPNQIAVDSSGNVYVTDPNNQRVLKETLSGGIYTQSIIGSGFNLPYGVAVDSTGNVYIADAGLNTLFKETLSGGSYIQSTIVNNTTFNWLNSVKTVAVDGHGNVYVPVSDGQGSNAGAIVVATPTAAGYFITDLSNPQGSAADPRDVGGIAIDSQNNVYVSDFSYQITKFSYPSTSFGSVAVGSTGGAVTIPFYSPEAYGGQTAGTQISAAAVSMGTAGEFTDTGTGTCDTNGSHIYASGETCTVVVTFSPKAPGVRKGAVEIVNGSGVVLATEYVSGIGTGPQVAFSSGPQSTVAAGLMTPTGVAVNGSGVVYIADPGTRGTIFVETPSGSGYTQSTLNETDNAPLSGQPIPGGVTVDGAGNLYFSNSWNNNTYGNSIIAVQYYNGSIYMTQPLAYPQQENGLTGPLGLAADPSGNIYVADTGNNRVVEEMYSSGVTYDTPAGYALQLVVASGLSGPQAVAADASGNVYIADTGNNRILLETPASGGSFTQSVLFNNGLNAPAGVAVDAFGNVFISDTGNKRVLMEMLSGTSYTQSVVPVTGLVSPQGLVVDASENLYIADSGTGSVLKIALGTGPSLPFASTNVGSTSSDSPQTVTFSNIGNAPLTFPIPATGTNPSLSSSSFSLNSTGSTACPLLTSTSLNTATLAAATSCTLPISFTPATSGSISGTLKLTDDALNVSGTVQTINLNGTGTSPTAPVASLSPTAIAFENQTVNTTSAASTITLSNTGNASLTGIAISITGANPADFAQTNTCGTTLAASASCTISITFTPASVASFTATLSVADNASNSPQTTTLSGSGTAVPAPIANLSPANLSFPSTSVSSTSAAQTLTLTNTGNAALTGIAISFAGANPADFAETTTCGATLAASASCTISVTFAPLSAASFTAAISVADNASGSPQTTALSGTGTPAPAPQALLSPASLGFGGQNTGTSSAAQTIALSNPGTAALSIGSIAITGVSAGAFSQTNTCGTTLAANASCIISVTFTPQVAGALTAAITVTDNASGSPQSAALSGTGTVPPAPQAVLTPASLVFASQLLNTTSAAQTITLSNPGTATLTISGISLTGSSSSAYATTTTCGATLAAGATCAISVTFTPAATGTLVAAITIADNAVGSPQSVALSGTGTNPATFSLAATPASQQINPGGAANFNINISSLGGTFTGAVALSVTGLPAGASGTFSATSVTPGSAGATSVLTVRTGSQSASFKPSRIPGAPVLAVLLLPPALWMRRRHRPGRLPLAMLLLFLTCLGLSSCAGGYFGPTPQSFALTVTGAADSIQQSTTVTLNVQ